MARILLLTPQLPYPPQQGTSLRNWHLLRWMATRHDVTLVSFADDPAVEVPAELSAICYSVTTFATPDRTTAARLRQLGLSSLPDMAERLRSTTMTDGIRHLLTAETFDIVQVEGLEMAYLIPTIRAGSGAAIVLDCHNAETELQRRAFAADKGQPGRWPAAAYSLLQRGRLAAYEASALRAADAVVAVSDDDATRLIQLAPETSDRCFVVPNSIDVREYDTPTAADGSAEAFDLVFSGKMDYRPNVDAVLWFAGSVWPQLKAAHRGLTWGIVGQRPHKQLDPLRGIDGITITGKVGSVRPFLEAAQVIILPLRIGSGTRLKLIEAMAASKPIVSTRIGAEGFPVTHGKELLLADSAPDFATAVTQLLADAALRARLGQAARAFAEAYDWRVVAPSLEAAYAAALARHRGATVP